MKNEDPRHHAGASGAFPEEFTGPNDPLWKLLGEARSVEVSPFFARNILREIRKPAPRLSIWQHVRALNWRWMQAAATIVLIAGVTLSQVNSGHQGKAGKQSTTRKDYEVISNLDTLLAAQETSVWLDDSEQ